MKQEIKILLLALGILLTIDLLIISSLFLTGKNLNDFSVHALDYKAHLDANGWDKENIHFPGYSWSIMFFNALTFNLLSWPLNAMIVSIIFQLLTAVVIFKSIRLLNFNSWKSGLITVLIMIFPIQIPFTTILPRIDSTISFLIALAFYFYLKKEENKMLLALILGTLVHYVVIFFSIFLGLYYLVNKKYTQIWKSFLIVIPFFVLCLYQYFVNNDFFHYISVHNEYVSGSLIVFPFYSLIQLLTKFTILDFLKFIYLLIFFTLMIYCVWVLIKNKKKDIIIFIMPFFLLAISLHGVDAYYDAPRFGIYHNFPLLIYPLSMMIDNWKNYKVKLIIGFFIAISFITLLYLVASFPLSNISIFYQLLVH